MQSHFKVSVIAVLLLASQIAFAAMVEVPPFTARVVDLTQTLSESEQVTLEAKLKRFEEAKGSQIAVLLVPTTQPDEIEQYSIRVVDEWKVGRKSVDDSVLILIAIDDRKMRIEVGYGLEGAIPDLYAKRIINETLTPKFKQGDFAGGIAAATDQIIGLIDGEPLPAPSKKNVGASQLEDLLPMLLFGSMISGIFLKGILVTFLAVH